LYVCVILPYYAGKAIQVATQNKVLSAKEKLKSVREKPSNLLKEPPKKKVVTGIGTLKIKVLKNPSQVQKKYLGQFLEEKQISIKELKNTFSSIEDNELFDKSNLKSLSSVANIIKELKAGKVLTFFLTGGRETNIFKYLGNDIFHLTEYSVEI
jgi:hypothetical protein